VLLSERKQDLPKRIAIATLGTRGDVQPYIALAVELMQRGHSVVIGAPSDFREFIISHGIEYCDLGSNIQSFLTTSRFEVAVSKNSLLSMPSLLAQGQQMVKRAAQASWKMAQRADAIIVNMNTTFGVDIAEALHIPAIMTALQPLDVTSEFPYCTYYGPSFGPVFNRLSYTAMNVQQGYFDLPRNRFRRSVLGLKARRTVGFSKDNYGNHLPMLYAFSDEVSPRPKDWPRSAVITGFWKLEDRASWEPDEAFRKFLAAGEAPVYIGFGSMPFRAKKNSELVIEAARRWGGRIVVSRGWGGISANELPDNIFAVENAPHDKLFNYVKAVVHHGGAGTTASGLYAGKPTFILPQTVDQPYWGRRVHELGCGPAPVRLQKITADTLVNALRDLTETPSYVAAAERMSATLHAERGAERAVDEIEGVMQYFSVAQRRPTKRFRFASARRSA
jgi:UDP:flavonoid glycosyltransferase YjiC (YdhE family)